MQDWLKAFQGAGGMVRLEQLPDEILQGVLGRRNAVAVNEGIFPVGDDLRGGRGAVLAVAVHAVGAEDFHEVQSALERHLPLRAAAGEAWLMALRSDERWVVHRRFALAAG